MLSGILILLHLGVTAKSLPSPVQNEVRNSQVELESRATNQTGYIRKYLDEHPKERERVVNTQESLDPCRTPEKIAGVRNTRDLINRLAAEDLSCQTHLDCILVKNPSYQFVSVKRRMSYLVRCQEYLLTKRVGSCVFSPALAVEGVTFGAKIKDVLCLKGTCQVKDQVSGRNWKEEYGYVKPIVEKAEIQNAIARCELDEKRLSQP